MNTISTIRPQAAPAPQSAPAPAPAEAPAPDLVVDSVVASNAHPTPGSSIYFDVTVSNRGDAAAAPFSVRVTGDGNLDQEVRVREGLAPGQSAKLAHVGPLKTDSYHSLYWVTATADSRDEVAERREDNNWMMTSVSPQHPPTPPTPPPPPPIPWPPSTLLAE